METWLFREVEQPTDIVEKKRIPVSVRDRHFQLCHKLWLTVISTASTLLKINATAMRLRMDLTLMIINQTARRLPNRVRYRICRRVNRY